MAKTTLVPKSEVTEGIQFLGSAASAKEIADWLKGIPNPPAYGAIGATLVIHGHRVDPSQWAIRRGNVVDVMADSDVTARFTPV